MTAMARMACGVSRQRDGLKMRAIVNHRIRRIMRGEVMREGEAHPDLGCQLRAVVARSQQPD